MAKNKFDEVLTEVGEFGLYQKLLVVFTFITATIVNMQNLSPVFTMKIPRHRCKIPGLANDTYEVHNSQHAMLINMTIPVDADGEYSKCSMYDVTGINSVLGENRTEVDCIDWVFDKSMFKSTYVTELKLVCHNKLYRSHSTVLVFAGKFLGAFCNSAAGDYFGRRRLFLVMLVLLTGAGIGLMFVSSLPGLMALRFLAGATTTGLYLPIYVIAMELMGTSKRRFVGIAVHCALLPASYFATLFAFLTRDWQYFQACLAAPDILLIAGFYFLPESPRWLVSRGRLEEAQKLIDKIAEVNGVSEAPTLTSDSFSSEDSPANKTSSVKVTPFQLLRIPRLFVRCVLLYSSWILVIMCLYGLSLNVTNMPGDIFLNYALMSSTEIVSIVIFTLLIERVGRRLFLLAVALLGGLVCLSTVVPTVLGSNDWILRGLSFAGHIFVSAGISGLYVISPELFPTVLRSFGLGSCSMMSRLGGLASPYVADLNIYVSGTFGPALPQVVFGVAGILTAIMVFFLPETKGRPLPETVRDAEQFGRTQTEDTPAVEMTARPALKESTSVA